MSFVGVGIVAKAGNGEGDYCGKWKMMIRKWRTWLNSIHDSFHDLGCEKASKDTLELEHGFRREVIVRFSSCCMGPSRSPKDVYESLEIIRCVARLIWRLFRALLGL